MEQIHSGLKELFDLWDSRSNLYGDVLYSSAIVRGNDGWRNAFTYFQPLHKTEERNTTLDADYGSFRLSTGLLSLDDVKRVLAGVIEKNELRLPNQPMASLKASLYPGSSRNFLRGDAKSYPVFFPCLEYRFATDQSTIGVPPYGLLWAPNLPLYPSGHVAIEETFFTKLGHPGSYNGVLSALVPDYRGKIEKIRLLNDRVEISVICLMGAALSDLAGKFYWEGYHGLRFSHDLSFNETGRAFAVTKEFPRSFVVVVFSKSTNELIDERAFDAGSSYLGGDLTIEQVEKGVENLIQGGESDAIEFKSQISKNQERIAIAAVAFANQKGGRILVGVDNEGQIVGCAAEGTQDTLTSILRDHCEPTLTFGIQQTILQDKPVFIINVPEGKDKPYQVKNKGFYLRMQATNRLVTRYELDQIYGSNPGSLWNSITGSTYE